MARTSTIFTNFTAGEVTPRLAARVDVAKFANSCRVLENYLPTPLGPAVRRPGTKFVSPVKTAANRVALIPFEFSTTQAYMLELGDLYIRFYKDRAPITLTAQAITGITKASPAVLTYSGADTYSNGDRVIVSGVLGMTQVNNREFTVAGLNAGANTFQLSGVDSSAYGTYTSGGTVAEIYEVVSPYAQADLFDTAGRCRLRYTQSADTLYLAHPLYAPRTLTRSAHTSWTLAAYNYQAGPCLDVNTTATTITPAGTGGLQTFDLSSTTGVNNNTGWRDPGDIGRIIRYFTAGVWGSAKIATIQSATRASADIIHTLGGTGASATWQIGNWSPGDGWPSCVTFHEERLCWAGAGLTPQRLDLTMTGAFTDFRPTDTAGAVQDDSAVAITIASDQVNAISDLVSARGLLVFTLGGEFAVGAARETEPMTPTNVKAVRQTKHGSANVMPIGAGNATLMLQRQNRRLREVSFSFEADSYVAPDMTLLAEHITKGGLLAMAYQQEPWSAVWAARADGTLLSFTYQRDQEVTAWARHPLGGTDASVEQVACIPGSSGQDELWLSVARTIGGGTVRYIEVLNDFPGDDTDEEDMIFVDSQLTYDGASADIITGAWHLNGETVQVLADAAQQTDRAVASGAITLDHSAAVVQLGLGYDSILLPQRLNAGAVAGTAQGQTKRIDTVHARVDRSALLKHGPSLDKLTSFTWPIVLGAGPALRSADLRAEFQGDFQASGDLYLVQDKPFPSTICGIICRVATNE